MKNDADIVSLKIATRIVDAAPRHLADIMSLYREQLLREPDACRITRYISEFPATVATTEGQIVGFAYTTKFAPDILELANILVAPQWRNRNTGSRLLDRVEEIARKEFKAIILVNSLLYLSADRKQSAERFYRRHGYQEILNTGPSKVYGKLLS